MEADELVRPQIELSFHEDGPDFVRDSEPLPADAASEPEIVIRQLDRLPASLKARIAYAPDRRVFQLKGVLSRDDRMTLQIAMAPIKGADRVIDGLFYRTNRIQASEAGEDREKPAFIVPRLCIWRQSELVLFSEEHFLDLPWDLAECDPVGILDRFAIRDDGQSGYVDVTERGKVEYFLSELHAQLTLAIHERQTGRCRVSLTG